MAQSTQRASVDVLRVRYWYEGLRLRTRRPTAYQLEKLFDPSSFRSEGGFTKYPHKWKRYEYGLHTPQQRLIERVDASYYGSEREINHPIWQILKKNLLLASGIDAWLKQLEPRVQTAVYRKPYRGESALSYRLAYTHSLGRRLIKLANLDGLAALLLYWTESNRAGRNDEACEIALHIYQILLVIFPDFKRRALEYEIFSLICHIVFDKTNWPCGKFVTSREIYRKSAITLHSIAFHYDSQAYCFSHASQARIVLNFIEGQKGMAVKYAMHPLFEPNLIFGPPSKYNLEECQKIEKLWRWGWHQIEKTSPAINVEF